MNPPSPPPSTEDLYEFYKLLKQRVDRIDGIVRQIQAEGTRDTFGRPTYGDIEALKKDIARLEGLLSSRRRSRQGGGAG